MILLTHNYWFTRLIIKYYNIPIGYHYTRKNKWLYYNEYYNMVLEIGSEYATLKSLCKSLYKYKEPLYTYNCVFSFIKEIKSFNLNKHYE